MMQGLMVRGLLRMAVVLGMRDQRMFELEGELRRIRSAVGEAWLKASAGDVAAAVELKCERLEKDRGDAEAECRKLHRRVSELEQIIEEADAEERELLSEVADAFKEMDLMLEGGVQAGPRKRLRNRLGRYYERPGMSTERAHVGRLGRE